MPKSPDDEAGRDILIEFVVQGSFVKVTAIHSGSGTEAVVVGSASAPRAALQAAAARELAFILSRKKRPG